MSYASPAVGSEFRIGNVLSRAFQLCVGNFPFFFIIMLIVALPNLWIEMSKPVLVPGEAPNLGSFFAILGTSTLLGIVLNTIGAAVILYGAFQRLRGQPLQPGAALQRAIARFLPLLGLAILYGLGLIVGFILLIIPCLILLAMWAVVVPACLVEGLGPIQSMSRSTQLTKGHRWQIFGMLFVLGLADAIGLFILGLILAPIGGVTVVAIVKLVWTAAWAVYFNCMLIMIYHDLRVAKEGVGTDQIAAVFD